VIYTFSINGLAADGQTWETQGTVETHKAGDFVHATNDALRQSFQQLTKGKAIYGKPGVACKGPYTLTKLVIERKADA